MRQRNPKLERDRRGSVYLLVLMVSFIVTTVALGAIMAVRAQGRAVDLLDDASEARTYAQSAIDLGRLWIAQDPHWRSNRTVGAWATSQPIGSGAFSLDAADPTNDLGDSVTDPVVLTGTGIKGQARQMIRVTLTPNATPLTCLNAALAAGGSITFISSVDPPGQKIASNSSVTASLGTINPDVDAVGAITGATYRGITTSPAPARVMPDNSTVFDYYIANGTKLTNVASSGYNISKCLLSPSNNPLGGGTNAKGIYIIDCGGQKLSIDTMRFVGTLVVLNAGSGSRISGGANFAPAVAGYPCLLVQGPMDFNLSGSPLKDSDANQNLNPPGTPYPYPSGTSNTTIGDSYPTEMHGLVYVAGSSQAQNVTCIGGFIVGGGVSGSGALSFTADPQLLTNPPPGFAAVQMIPSPGTWQQIVN